MLKFIINIFNYFIQPKIINTDDVETLPNQVKFNHTLWEKIKNHKNHD